MKLLPLTKGLFSKVDDDTYAWAHHYKWIANKTPRGGYYVVHNIMQIGKCYHVYLHKLILGVPIQGMVIDHKNGDSLDNQRLNLEIKNQRKNSQNRKEHRKGHLLGSSWNKRDKIWSAKIQINGKMKHLGSFNTAEKAHEAYLEAENNLI